jgi:hypothetical protein
MNSFPLALIFLSFAAIAKAASGDGNPFIAGSDVKLRAKGLIVEPVGQSISSNAPAASRTGLIL